MSKKDSRQLQQETFATIASDITTIIYALLTIPVFSSLILTMCKLFIHTVLPKTLVDFEKSNVKLIDKLLNVTDWLVKFLSKSATIYIKGIQMILSAIPKYKRLNDTERKKIAVGIYYTVTIGFAIKVIKTIMIKKGVSTDGSSLNLIKQSIIDGLKATTHEFDFDNIDSEGGEALFSKGQLVPISSLLSGQISKLLYINEKSLNEIDFNSDTNKNPSKVDNFLNRLDNAIVKNPRMVGGKLIVDLTTQIESITVELILKEIKNK